MQLHLYEKYILAIIYLFFTYGFRVRCKISGPYVSYTQVLILFLTRTTYSCVR